MLLRRQFSCMGTYFVGDSVCYIIPHSALWVYVFGCFAPRCVCTAQLESPVTGVASSPPYLWSVALSGQPSVCVISPATLPSPPVPSTSTISFFFPPSCFFHHTVSNFIYPPMSQSLSFLPTSPFPVSSSPPAEALEGNVTD